MQETVVPDETRPRPPAGIVAGAAILAAAAGALLWAHMLMGPVRLGTGLVDSAEYLNNASQKLTAGNAKAARLQTAAGTVAAARARNALDSPDPLLDALTPLPQIGDALGEADDLVAAAEHSATAARATLRITDNALQGPLSVIAEGEGNDPSRIRIERIEVIAEHVDFIRKEVNASKDALESVDLGNLPRRARPRIERAIVKAEDADAALIDAAAAFEILPDILGRDEPRNYLIGMQNSAEQRGTGGAILQYQLLTLDQGVVELQREAGSIYDVDKNRKQLDIPLPDDAWYQRGIPDARRFGNANWSPDFPLSSKLLLAYAYASSPKFPEIHGVIGVDPVALQNLIPATGPFRTKQKTRIDQKRVVRYVLNEAYGRFPRADLRRKRLRSVVTAFYNKVFDPRSPTKLLEGLSRSLSHKHLQIWMAAEGEQDFIERMEWDGQILRAPNADYLYVVEQNVGGNKLDYFDAHDNSASIRIEGRDAVTTTAMTVANHVTLPQARWVMGDSGENNPPIHRPMMNLYLHKNARLLGTKVDGTRVDTPAPAVWTGGAPPSHSERGKKVFPVTLEILPRRAATATFDYRVPGIVRTVRGRNVYRLVVQHQPKVHPEMLTLDLDLPAGAEDVRVKGWKRRGEGRLRWAGKLTKDMILEVSWRS